jgi:hypothetical protein
MKTPLRFVLTAAFLTFTPGTEAAMWSSVISNEKMRAEIDLASLLRQGGVVTAWDREIFTEMEQARPGDFYFKSAKSLMRYNCNARTADLLMKVYYAEDGSEITTLTASYYGKPNYVIPDTEGEQKFAYACQYIKPEEKRLATVIRKQSGESKGLDKAVKSEKVKQETPAVVQSPPKVFPSARPRPAIRPSRIPPVSTAKEDKAVPSK